MAARSLTSVDPDRRVALLTLGDPFRVSGGYLYHLRMAQAGPRNGFRIAFFTFPNRPFPLPAVASQALLRKVAVWRADVVVVDSLIAEYLAFLRPDSSRQPLVGSLHQVPGGIAGRPVLHWLRSHLDLSAYERCVALIVASDSLAEDLVHRGIPKEKLAVVPPGKNPAIPRGERIDMRLGRNAAALCVANWLPAKGILDLLAALRPLPQELMTLHLVGDTAVDKAFASKVTAAIEDPGLQGRVVVHGIARPEHVAALYRDADFFVLPSYAEAFGTVLAEALSAGLPVIGWRLGNLPNLATEEEAIMLPPSDIPRLSHALQLLASDENLRLGMGERARRRCRSLPTWEDSSHRFFKALASVLP